MFTPDADQPMRRLGIITNHSDWFLPSKRTSWLVTESVSHDGATPGSHLNWLLLHKTRLILRIDIFKLFLTFSTFLCDLIFQEFFSQTFRAYFEIKEFTKKKVNLSKLTGFVGENLTIFLLATVTLADWVEFSYRASLNSTKHIYWYSRLCDVILDKGAAIDWTVLSVLKKSVSFSF